MFHYRDIDARVSHHGLSMNQRLLDARPAIGQSAHLFTRGEPA
jgi:hypothetical protein